MASQIVQVGVDDGHNNICIYALKDGEELKMLMPSRAINGFVNKISVGEDRKSVFTYEVGPEIFSVGEIDHSLKTTFDEYPVSDMNRVLVNHALVRAGFADMDLSIVTGLPMRHFYRRKAINKTLVKAKQRNLLSGSEGGNIKPRDEEIRIPRILKHDVLPEGVAAWMDLYINLDVASGAVSRDEEVRSERIAIVDIGGRTTDIAVVKNMDVDNDRSATLDQGMLGVYDYIREAIRDEFSAEDIDDDEIQQSINSRRIKIFGERQDVSDIVDEAKRAALGRIYSEVKYKLGNASDIQKVYFVGGGSMVFEDVILEWFPRNGIVSSDPLYANARGMFKYALLRSAS